MAITVQHVEDLLKEIGIQNFSTEENYIRFSMGPCDRYVRPDGQDSLFLVIDLTENGEYFRIFSPRAYQIQGPHIDAFLRTAAIIQWKTKLIQFEYDPSDGEVRPIIEWPIEDGTLTATQLRRCVSGLLGLLDDFHPVLQRALADGVVVFPDERKNMIERLEVLLDKLKAQQAADEAKSDEEPGSGEDGPPSVL